MSGNMDGNMTGWDQIIPSITGLIHFYDVIIGIISAIMIPVIYTRIQKLYKKLRVIKFWNIYFNDLDRIKKGLDRTDQIATISFSNQYVFVLLKMKHMEPLVSDIFTEEEFQNYLDRSVLVEQNAKDSTGKLKDKVIDAQNWLRDCILDVKLPFYIMKATPQSRGN